MTAPTEPAKADAASPDITAAGIRAAIEKAIIDAIFGDGPPAVDAVLATLPISLEDMAALARGGKRVGGDWQPIETAPKDGTLVAALCDDGDVVTASYDHEDDLWLDHGCAITPIRWAPIPAAPKETPRG